MKANVVNEEFLPLWRSWLDCFLIVFYWFLSFCEARENISLGMEVGLMGQGGGERIFQYRVKATGCGGERAPDPKPSCGKLHLPHDARNIEGKMTAERGETEAWENG